MRSLLMFGLMFLGGCTVNIKEMTVNNPRTPVVYCSRCQDFMPLGHIHLRHYCAPRHRAGCTCRAHCGGDRVYYPGPYERRLRNAPLVGWE